MERLVVFYQTPDEVFHQDECYILIDQDDYSTYIVPLPMINVFLVEHSRRSYSVITSKSDLKKCLNLNILNLEAI